VAAQAEFVVFEVQQLCVALLLPLALGLQFVLVAVFWWLPHVLEEEWVFYLPVESAHHWQLCLLL